jgi:hypothetical protein
VWYVGSYFHDQGLDPCLLQWKQGASITGLLGKSPDVVLHFCSLQIIISPDYNILRNISLTAMFRAVNIFPSNSGIQTGVTVITNLILMLGLLKMQPERLWQTLRNWVLSNCQLYNQSCQLYNQSWQLYNPSGQTKDLFVQTKV